MEHNEFVVEFKNNGGRDWIDPIEKVWEDENWVYVSNYSHEWKYLKSRIDKWTVRPYSPETTFDPIEEE